jgi:hypothetical protein
MVSKEGTQMIKAENLQNQYFIGHVTEELTMKTGDEFVLIVFQDQDGEDHFARIYARDIPPRFPFMDNLTRIRKIRKNQILEFRILKCHSDNLSQDFIRAVDIREAK